jgi:hypothetical protein
VRRRDNVPGEWRKLRNEELHNIYYRPPNCSCVQLKVDDIEGGSGRWVDEETCIPTVSEITRREQTAWGM